MSLSKCMVQMYPASGDCGNRSSAFVLEKLNHVLLLMIARHSENEMADQLKLFRQTMTRKKACIGSAPLVELQKFGFLQKVLGVVLDPKVDVG
ncbi:hypothetical protein [Mariniblastus fucicola]|uniref:Uncharacterized protein n=1 Tax=Mariniblastus fucicola TaxID=980251 RepID=A0A5B9PDS1_9BACT|nr:hypothetical protein [Mariniblastus fucicola]QEG23639.1 hypothetical protein MFFC18_35400 [Mariniblastus fucicola]